MTKERREELRAKVNYWESGAGGENWGPMEPDELRSLLDSDERLEHVTQWLERYAGSAGSYYNGSASCARMALLEIEAGPDKPRDEACAQACS